MSDSSVSSEEMIAESAADRADESTERAARFAAEPGVDSAVPGAGGTALPLSAWIGCEAIMALAVLWCGVAAWIALVYIRDLELAASLGYYMSLYMSQAAAQQSNTPYVRPDITFNPAVAPATRLIWLAIMWIVGLWAWLAGFLPVAGKAFGRAVLALGVVLVLATVVAYVFRLVHIAPGVILGFLAVATVVSGLLGTSGARIGRRVFLTAGVFSILTAAGIYSSLWIYAYANNMYNALFSFQSTPIKVFFYGGLVACGMTLLAFGITMSANADGARTGRQMARAAGILMILSTAATYVGIYALTRWGGFPPLPPGTLVMVCGGQILHGLVLLAFARLVPKRSDYSSS